MRKNEDKVKFNLPIFKKQQRTNKGVIEFITHHSGVNWYGINGQWYAETELHLV